MICRFIYFFGNVASPPPERQPRPERPIVANLLAISLDFANPIGKDPKSLAIIRL
jgi:hypothetical protein